MKLLAIIAQFERVREYKFGDTKYIFISMTIMAYFGGYPHQFQPLFTHTLEAHRFYSDQFEIYKLELIQINGEYYFGIQKYSYSPRFQSYVPDSSLVFHSQTWNIFLRLAINFWNYVQNHYPNWSSGIY